MMDAKNNGRYLGYYKKEDCPPVSMATCLAKAINPKEVAVKEKHVRSAIIGTYQERGASTFWTCVLRIPLKENPVTCWKFCHVLHKILREGHDHVLRDSQKFKGMLAEQEKFWSHLKISGYGELIKLYCNLLSIKLSFHHRNPRIPGNLEIEEQLLFQTAGDEDTLFQLSVEMFDYVDAILELQLEIFQTLDTTRCSSMTNAGQCRLKPLIPCIQDSILLYDYVTKILFRLHVKLSPDLLNEHRDRFRKVFTGLQKFYERTMSLQYFKQMIEIQNLPKNPPNFLIQVDLANYQSSRITVFNSEKEMDDTESHIVSEHLDSMNKWIRKNVIGKVLRENQASTVGHASNVEEIPSGLGFANWTKPATKNANKMEGNDKGEWSRRCLELLENPQEKIDRVDHFFKYCSETVRGLPLSDQNKVLMEIQEILFKFTSSD